MFDPEFPPYRLRPYLQDDIPTVTSPFKCQVCHSRPCFSCQRLTVTSRVTSGGLTVAKLSVQWWQRSNVLHWMIPRGLASRPRDP